MLIEVGLRCFDVGRPTDAPDPFAGFNRNFPLFERHGAVYRTARSREPLIAPLEFPADKPRGAFRAFCFGGSTVYGHPYVGDTAFPQWLELELAGSDPSRSWQAINCGGISYASYRIAPMVKEVLAYQPDLIVVATGENEFLEDRTYTALKSRSAAWAWVQAKVQSLRLAGLVRSWRLGGAGDVAATSVGAVLGPTVNPRLDYESGYASYRRDPAWRERVFAQFDESLRTIAADCRAAGVPLVLIGLGSNLRDCPPFKSAHRAGLAPEPEADWQAAFDIATAAEKTDLARALRYYREAAQIDAEHALLSYRIARVLDRLGRPAEALPYFLKARDDDICPLRLMSPQEKILEQVAADTRTPLVDVAALLRAKSPDGLPGNDWYLDHVHPTIGGNQLMAQAIVAQLRASGALASSAAVWPEAKRVEAYTRHFAALPPAYFADGERRVVWLENWSKRQKLAAETLPVDAAGFARMAFRCFELGQDETARASLREAFRRDRRIEKLVTARARQLAAEGRPDRAAVLLAHARDLGNLSAAAR